MDLCVRADRVISVSEPGAIERGAVLVRGGRIVAVGRAADLAPPEGTPVLDLGALTLVPGLIDGHAHLMLDGSAEPMRTLEAESDSQLLLRMVRNLGALLRAGVTTVRDCGCRNHLSLVLRDAISSGLLVGPNVVSAGKALTITGGHYGFVGHECDGADALRQAIRAEAKAGVDFIKVMGSGGRSKPGTAGLRRSAYFTDEEMALIVRESHRIGKRVAVHAHPTAVVRTCAGAGVDIVEHCLWLDESAGYCFDERAVERIAEQGAFVCPTLAGFFPRHPAARGIDPEMPKIEELLPYFARMRELGVRFVSGNDTGAPYTPFDDLVYGLEIMGRFGLSPAEQLAAATLTAAACLGRDDVGALAAGRRADLVAVRGNPLDDIRALWQVEVVVKDGHVVHRRDPLAATAPAV